MSFSRVVTERQLMFFFIGLGDALGFVIDENPTYHNHGSDAGSWRYLVAKNLNE